VREGKTQVVITALDAQDEFVNNQTMTATAVTPDMKSVPIRVEQVAPGRYVGEFPSEMAGSYLVVVNPGAGKTPIRTGVNVGYSAEYRDNETNTSLLESLAKIPAGRGPQGEYTKEGLAEAVRSKEQTQNPFRRDLPRAITNQSIWPWLVVAAACLFWTDVFVRRVQINFTWLFAALARVRDVILRREPKVAVPETMSRLRTRKQEIGEQIESRKATARFESTDPPDTDPTKSSLGEARLSGPGAHPSTTPPKSLEEKSETQPESYTERLLKAKKQVWRDRDEDQPGQEKK
jgi:hypothetical protein